jgi:ER lumen protein retaining receptor
LVIQKTREVGNITAHYLVALQGAYRILYIPNWVYRYFAEDYWDPIAVLGGVIQVCLTTLAIQQILGINADSKASTGPSIRQRIGFHLLYFIRFVQLVATVISGYIFCNLLWSQHNYHCEQYPAMCTLVEIAQGKLRWPFIFMISVVSLLAKVEK